MKPAYTIIMLLSACTIFFFMGFLFYPTFYQFVLPAVDGIQYRMNLAEMGDRQDIFGLVMASIPLLLFLTWRLIPLYTIDKKNLSVLVTIICMTLAVYMRYKMLENEFAGMVESASNRLYAISVPFEQLQFEWYLLGGLISGCIVTYLAFHNKVIRRPLLFQG